MSEKTRISVARGDGIGPEIMEATLRVLDATDARLEIEEIEAGRDVYEQGYSSGVAPSAWESLRDTRVLLKSPITTPQGGGYKSLNVTIRKTLSLYANVRPAVAYDPIVPSNFPGMDVVIVRENEEDSYSGIEYRQSEEMTSGLKFITRPGSERICRFAFEWARQNDRDRITCMTKDNILKMTDGTFHDVFEEVATDYPDIESDHLIIDIGTGRLAANPTNFDVIVAPNLYGDILSDITAELSGSVGLCGSANIGDDHAMFEAIHGSAPDIAGEGIANPSGLLHGAIMMLSHIGQGDVATTIHNAWLSTIEDGVHTADIFDESTSDRLVDTDEFTDALIDRLGDEPEQFSPVDHPQGEPPTVEPVEYRVPDEPEQRKELVGVDVFLEWRDGTPADLGESLEGIAPGSLSLEVITNRGMKVWPDPMPETWVCDQWQCRFRAQESIEHARVIELLELLDERGFDFVKTEHLYTFDGEDGFTKGQGV